MWWSSVRRDLPRSVAGLRHTYLDKTAKSLTFSALVAYPVHTMGLNLNEKRRRYVIDHGRSLLGILLDRAAELKKRDR